MERMPKTRLSNLNKAASPLVQTGGLRALFTAADLDAALCESHEHPVLLFKHSRACGLSQRALARLLEHLRISHAPISYLITVQSHRHMCETIARILGVPHETPQAILVDGGNAIWQRTHHQITAEAFVAVASLGRYRLREPGQDTSGSGEAEVEDSSTVAGGGPRQGELGP